jgi:uncharacterized protein (TIGR02118 family)
MAAKLIALYSEPDNREEFDKLYFETHVPLAQKLPGLARLEVAKVTENMMGGESPYYMIAELHFDSVEDLKAAMGSPEGRAAGKNLMSFAAKNTTMLISEITSSVGAGVY